MRFKGKAIKVNPDQNIEQTLIVYGLLLNGELLGFSTSSNSENDFCVDIQYKLEKYSDNVWLVAEREIAENAAITDTEWFNADYHTPSNPYVENNLTVVEVTLTYNFTVKQ